MKRWTKEETGLLKQNMDATLLNLKQLLPDRTEDMIIEKIKVLYRQVAFDRWNEDELNIIRANPNRSVFELLKLLPNRTFSAIVSKRAEIRGTMGVSRDNRVAWSTEDISQLKYLKSEGYTNYEIALTLGRPLNSVIGRLSTESLMTRKSRGHAWTPKELELVREKVAGKVSIEAIGRELNLPTNKVFQKAIHLGFRSAEIVTASSHTRKEASVLREQIKELTRRIKIQDKTIIKLSKKQV